MPPSNPGPVSKWPFLFLHIGITVFLGYLPTKWGEACGVRGLGQSGNVKFPDLLSPSWARWLVSSCLPMWKVSSLPKEYLAQAIVAQYNCRLKANPTRVSIPRSRNIYSEKQLYSYMFSLKRFGEIGDSSKNSLQKCNAHPLPPPPPPSILASFWVHSLSTFSTRQHLFSTFSRPFWVANFGRHKCE
jgi:hypothetical protein